MRSVVLSSPRLLVSGQEPRHQGLSLWGVQKMVATPPTQKNGRHLNFKNNLAQKRTVSQTNVSFTRSKAFSQKTNPEIV